MNCNPVPRGTGNHPHKALWNSGLTSADSGFQPDSGDRVKRLSSEGAATPDPLTPDRRFVETSGDVIEFIRKAVPNECRALLSRAYGDNFDGYPAC